MLYLPRFIRQCTTCKAYKLFSEFKKSATRCKVCDSRYNKQHYLEHYEQRLRDAKEYYYAHKEERQNYNRQKGKEHYLKNKKRISVRHRNYWSNNREHLNAVQREHYRQHPEQYATNGQRRRARKKSVLSTFTYDDWVRCLDYWYGLCAYCGRQRGLWQTEMAQDHFVPLNQGGTYTPDNIIPACNGIDGCNQRKRDQDAYEWMTEHFGKRHANQRLKRIREYFDWLNHH